MVDLTIRDVPLYVRDEIERQAGLRGQSIEEFLRQVLIRLASQHEKASALARIEKHAVKQGEMDVMSFVKRSPDGRY